MRDRRNVDPRQQAELALMARRARWSMERPTGGSQYNIIHRFSSQHSNVRVYDIYLVDTTRRGRDPEAGIPIYLGTSPYLEEAEAFVADHARGRQVFYFRGFRTEFRKHVFEKARVIGGEVPETPGRTDRASVDAGASPIKIVHVRPK